eukprot:g36141.t1
MPIECAEVFCKVSIGGLANTNILPQKNEIEDFDADSDFEVLMKTAHGHLASATAEKEKESAKTEFNNHKDYNQEKPSRLKQ